MQFVYYLVRRKDLTREITLIIYNLKYCQQYQQSKGMIINSCNFKLFGSCLREAFDINLSDYWHCRIVLNNKVIILHIFCDLIYNYYFQISIMNPQKVPSLNPEISIQQLSKFRQNFRRKKLNIEKKYNKSTVNKLYIFPRNLSSNNSTFSSSSEQQIPVEYNLKQQNKKSRHNQIHCPNDKISQHQKNNPKKQNNLCQIEDVLAVQDARKTMKARKNKNIQISFDTRKKTPSKSQKYSSQPKLLVEQYSVENRIHTGSKNSSKGLLISFRGSKNQDINVSMSGKRVKTQIF